mmetsp:Transcript_22526/g.62579  ORF Transcript_22526/g.62579 Transcript_22526/m.62579 type:complete len:1110 (-) Transcript_22526:33-3362(-)
MNQSVNDERKRSPLSSDNSPLGDVDEWIFSIRLPEEASSSNQRVFNLQQAQPPHPKTRSPSPLSGPSSRSGDVERESLLTNTNSPSNDLGWSFTSPYWKLDSKFVLQITYRPAWQAIPEFTRCNACAAKAVSAKPSNSFAQSVGSYLCGGGCGCRAVALSDRIDFFTQTWTAADVVNVEKIDALEVIGVGYCQALRLTLSPLPLSDDFPRQVPSHLEEAWAIHLQNIESSPAPHVDQVSAPTITFCLPFSQVDPPLLWKVQLPSLDDDLDIAVETFTVMEGTLAAAEEPPTHIYINGYQSWSFAGSVVMGHKQPQPALPGAFSRAFDLGGSVPPPGEHVLEASTLDSLSGAKASHGASSESMYQSDFFTCITADGDAPTELEPRILQRAGIAEARVQEEAFPFQKLDETGGPALVLGWLAQRQQFGVVTADLKLRKLAMHASADGSILPGSARRNGHASQQETDWALAQLVSPHSYDEEPMVHYLHSVAAHNHARPLQNGTLLTGWCSWYHYYNGISEYNLRENFTKLAAMRTRVPTNVAVVDDGYMRAWGDWSDLKPGKFECGMHSIADDIASNGMRPGLWLAPFAADKHSKLTSSSQHPEYVIRNDFGAPANSGNCGKFFYGLDATNPGVRQHVHDAIHRAVYDWGYNVLKIDFLYAACLQGNGKYDLSVSRAQAMHIALDAIRKAAGPDVFLIGCGCPVASAIGFVDGMRISADTGPTWLPPPPLPWWDNGTLPSLRSMIRNSISRAPLGHRWFHNDPDCLLLGESTRLSDVEVSSAATVVAMTCGMMLLSDDLTKVSLSRMRIVTKIFPMAGASAIVLDLHSTNDGLPSLMRLWATDRDWEKQDELRKTMNQSTANTERDHNAEATFFARQASFVLHEDVPPPNERKRSCIHAPTGLGSWTIVSVSNWSDRTAVLSVPQSALLPPPLSGFDAGAADTFLDDEDGSKNANQHGYHVLGFWSSRYSWLPPQSESGEQETIKSRLEAHETEIFHVKRVEPELPQYIGSDLHFSCCKEVLSFVATTSSIQIELKSDYDRVGSILVFLPVINTQNVKVAVNGTPGQWVTVGNTPKVAENGSPRLVGRVIRIMVVVHAEGEVQDGQISIEF